MFTCLVEEQHKVDAEGQNQSDVFHGVEVSGQVADEPFCVSIKVNLKNK